MSVRFFFSFFLGLPFCTPRVLFGSLVLVFHLYIALYRSKKKLSSSIAGVLIVCGG